MRIVIVNVALLLGGCTVATMQGFDRIAATTNGNRLNLTNIPGWQDGPFRMGGSQGHVRRRARGAINEWSDDPWNEVTRSVIERTGTLTFDLAGTEAGGRIEGRCRYGRVGEKTRLDGLSIARTVRPLRFACAYRFEGREVGGMDLTAIEAPPHTLAEPRLGTVRVNGAELTIVSSHTMTAAIGASDTPIGYVLTRADKTIAGAIELNGVGSRRLIVPRAPDERRAALAAMVTLALFWDPGDTD